MSAPFHRHPRFAEFYDLFRAHPDWFKPWTCSLFRFHTVDYPKPKDILSGKGAASRGGRWNPPGLPAVYGSTTDTTALEECKAKWSEGVPPSPKQEKALMEMDRLLDALARVMQPEQVGHWLKTPNQAFDGSTPLQVVERGEIDVIWRMLYDLESGQPG